jgi:fatty acid desaturase
VETVAFGVLLFFGLLNLWVFHRFKKPLLPLVLALFISFLVFFLSPVLGLLVFLLGQTLAFYAAGKR